jgi:four helix bundle protein
MEQKGYKKLDVWCKADQLAYQVYLATLKFPRNEAFGITSQLRRAALSVPTNLVEASGRQNRNETRQFANIALGSLAETEYLLEFCQRLNYLSKEEYEHLERLRSHLGAGLWKFYKSFV